MAENMDEKTLSQEEKLHWVDEMKSSALELWEYIKSNNFYSIRKDIWDIIDYLGFHKEHLLALEGKSDKIKIIKKADKPA